MAGEDSWLKAMVQSVGNLRRLGANPERGHEAQWSDPAMAVLVICGNFKMECGMRILQF
jgi:hypothetical protein